MKKLVFVFFIFPFSLVFAQSDTTKGIWTLQACVDRALQQNITVNQSLLTSHINLLTLGQSKANWLPNLNAADVHSLNFGRSLNPFTYQFVNQSVSINSPSLTSSVTLYNGLEIKNTVKQNQLNYDAGNFDVETEKNTIALNVVADYLQVLMSYEQVDNTMAQVAVSNALVDEMKKFVDAGKYSQSNLLQMQSQLANDKLSEVNAENQLQLAKVGLEQLMLLPISDNFEVVKPVLREIEQPEIYTAPDVYKTAETIMPQIKSAALKTQSALFGIKIARSQEIPTLTLGGMLKTGYSSVSTSNQTVYDQETIGYLQGNTLQPVLGEIPTTIKNNYPWNNQFSDNFTQQISLSLSIPIFNNKIARTAVEKAKTNADIAKLNEEGTRIQLRQSVEQAVTDEKGGEKQYIASKEAYATEELTFHNMEIQFKVGKSNATDYLIEKNNDEKALANLVQAKYNYLFKIKVVDYYLGQPLTF